MTTRITSLALAAALATGIATGAQAAHAPHGGFDKSTAISTAVPAFGIAANTGSHIAANTAEKTHETGQRSAFGVTGVGGTHVAAQVGEKRHGLSAEAAGRANGSRLVGSTAGFTPTHPTEKGNVARNTTPAFGVIGPGKGQPGITPGEKAPRASRALAAAGISPNSADQIAHVPARPRGR